MRPTCPPADAGPWPKRRCTQLREHSRTIRPAMVRAPLGAMNNYSSFVCTLRDEPLSREESREESMHARWLQWAAVFYSKSRIVQGQQQLSAPPGARRKEQCAESQILVLNTAEGVLLLFAMDRRTGLQMAQRWIAGRMKGLVSQDEIERYCRSTRPLSDLHLVDFGDLCDLSGLAAADADPADPADPASASVWHDAGVEAAEAAAELSSSWVPGQRTVANIKSFERTAELRDARGPRSDVGITQGMMASGNRHDDDPRTPRGEEQNAGGRQQQHWQHQQQPEQHEHHLHGGCMEVPMGGEAAACFGCQKAIQPKDARGVCAAEGCAFVACLSCRALCILEYTQHQRSQHVREWTEGEMREDGGELLRLAVRDAAATQEAGSVMALYIEERMEKSLGPDGALAISSPSSSSAATWSGGVAVVTDSTGTPPRASKEGARVDEYTRGILWLGVSDAHARFEVIQENKEARRHDLLTAEVARKSPTLSCVCLSQVVETGWDLVQRGALPGVLQVSSSSAHRRLGFLNRCIDVHAGCKSDGSSKKTWRELTRSRGAADAEEVRKINQILGGKSDASAFCSACLSPLREQPRFYLDRARKVWKPACMMHTEKAPKEVLKMFCSTACERKWNSTLVCPACGGTAYTRSTELDFPDTRMASQWYPSGGDEQSRQYALNKKIEVPMCVKCNDIMLPRDPWPHHMRTPRIPYRG